MRKHIISLAVAVTVLASTVATQTEYVTTAPGVWKPWSFTAYSDDARRLAARSPDLGAVDASLRALAAILKQSPGFAAPIGFSAQASGGLDFDSFRPGQPDLKTLPIASTLLFGAFGIAEYTRNGKTVRDDSGETTMLIFSVNSLTTPIFQAQPIPEFEPLETDVTRLADPQPDVLGMPRYADTIVLKKNPAPIWTPVPLGEALSLAIRGIEARLTESRDVVARIQKSRDEITDPAQRAKRLADYKLAASLSKDPKALESLMKGEDGLQTLLAPLAKDIADATARANAIERENEEAKNTLAGLPAAKRAAPACYATRESVSLSRFQSEPRPGCVALVRPNWKLFNPALPRSAPQVLAITHFEGCLLPQNLPHPGGCVANKKLLETMDKQALLDWLR